MNLDSNCGQEGCQNRTENSALLVTPQMKMYGSIYTLTLNSKVQWSNKEVCLSIKSNASKIWSILPTSDYVTNITKSIITN